MSSDGSLSSDEFLKKVVEYFLIANEKHITVRLTIKRLMKNDPVEPILEYDSLNHPEFDVSTQAQSVQTHADAISQEEYLLLLRASYGSHKSKAKCSTVVESGNLDQFWQKYSSVVRSCMNGLVKTKKKKKKTAKKTPPKAKKSKKSLK